MANSVDSDQMLHSTTWFGSTAPDKVHFSNKGNHIFCTSLRKHMLWVLIRSASPRCFKWVPTTYVSCKNKKNILWIPSLIWSYGLYIICSGLSVSNIRVITIFFRKACQQCWLTPVWSESTLFAIQLKLIQKCSLRQVHTICQSGSFYLHT